MTRVIKRLSVGFIGAVVLCLGAFFLVSNYVDGSWPRVAGTVVGSRNVAGVSSPVVEYEAMGTKFQVISSKQPLFANIETGEKRQIAFNPNSPGEAKIVQSGFLAAMPWLLVGTGAAMILTTIVLHKRLQNESHDEADLSGSEQAEDDKPTYQV